MCFNQAALIRLNIDEEGLNWITDNIHWVTLTELPLCDSSVVSCPLFWPTKKLLFFSDSVLFAWWPHVQLVPFNPWDWNGLWSSFSFLLLKQRLTSISFSLHGDFFYISIYKVQTCWAEELAGRLGVSQWICLWICVLPVLEKCFSSLKGKEPDAINFCLLLVGFSSCAASPSLTHFKPLQMSGRAAVCAKSIVHLFCASQLTLKFPWTFFFHLRCIPVSHCFRINAWYCLRTCQGTIFSFPTCWSLLMSEEIR